MVESENRQLLSSIKCQDAVVFAAGSCSDEIQQRVARLFEQLQARSLVNRVTFCDVTRVDAMDSIPTGANVFVFLIDDDHLNSAGASRAAFLATRKSVTGKALVVSLLTQADAAYEKSPLSFMPPVDAYGDHLEDALLTLERNACDFLSASSTEAASNAEPLNKTEKTSCDSLDADSSSVIGDISVSYECL